MLVRRFAPPADNLAIGDPLLIAGNVLSQARDCVEEQAAEAAGVHGDEPEESGDSSKSD